MTTTSIFRLNFIISAFLQNEEKCWHSNNHHTGLHIYTLAYPKKKKITVVEWRECSSKITCSRTIYKLQLCTALKGYRWHLQPLSSSLPFNNKCFQINKDHYSENHWHILQLSGKTIDWHQLFSLFFQPNFLTNSLPSY